MSAARAAREFGVAGVELPIEARELAACVFQKSFLIQGGRSCKRIYKQDEAIGEDVGRECLPGGVHVHKAFV
jgi:hypothetical protein